MLDQLLKFRNDAATALEQAKQRNDSKAVKSFTEDVDSYQIMYDYWFSIFNKQ